jgi:hypothetical protein
MEKLLEANHRLWNKSIVHFTLFVVSLKMLSYNHVVFCGRDGRLTVKLVGSVRKLLIDRLKCLFL